MLLVSPADVHRVLVDKWGVYTSANREKRAVLSRSQPRGVVISGGPERPVRREFNEAALDTKRRVQLFHRDSQRLPCADAFSPEIWLKDRRTEAGLSSPSAKVLPCAPASASSCSLRARCWERC
jgi:hypothetical protein